MKQLKRHVIFLVALSALFLSHLSASAEKTVFQRDERTQRIVKQEAIIDEGNLLVERGLYDEAIVKFQEALDPPVLNDEADKGRAIYFIEKIYKLQGKYGVALEELQWSIRRNQNGAGWIDEKLELEALTKARGTRSVQPIYEHIEYLKNKYTNELPPQGYAFGFTDGIFARITRLYNYLGDQDAAIALADQILAYPKLSGKPYERPRQQYEIIKAALVQDKQESFKGCLEAEPGDVCMGRATKALIQSDYFSW